MFENTVVKLPLEGFDVLRAGEQAHKNITSALAHCFEYECTKNPEPLECKDCKTALDCDNCEIDKSNPKYTEKLTVDVERLIAVAKEYALYGKGIETELDAITVERKAERV